MNSCDLSIIIVNYNGAHFLKDCIAALKLNITPYNYEVIIVDNNSTDQSVQVIKTEFPEVNLIESKQNLGFGRANNLGVSYAKAKTILLLNNDTILLSPISFAFNTLYSSHNTGVVTYNMLNGERKYTSAVGRFPKPLRLLKISFLSESRAEFKKGVFDKSTYSVDWVTGAFMLMRKRDFELINGFDKDFFMYVEDVDFCRRLQNKGKQCLFMSEQHYIHFVGFNKKREHLLIKGYQTYAQKHFKGFQKHLALLMLTINKLVKNIKKRLN